MEIELWAVLYLHNWDESAQIAPEIHGIYDTWREAHEVVSRMEDSTQYFVRSVPLF
jgi:hypothetical protein